jgi:hypothetical protein
LFRATASKTNVGRKRDLRLKWFGEGYVFQKGDRVMRDFKVGDRVKYRYGLAATDYGVVTEVDEKEFTVHFDGSDMSGARWPQPSTGHIPARLWTDPDYIQLVEDDQEQSDPETVDRENKMRDFEVGDRVKYKYGLAATNYGVVAEADEKEFTIHFDGSNLGDTRWPQPSTGHIPARLWTDPDYIQLVEDDQENKMRDFEVGDRVRFAAVSSCGRPLWDMDQKRDSKRDCFLSGTVNSVQADEKTFRVWDGLRTWEWPQPSANKVPEELWKDPTYIHLLGDDQEQSNPTVDDPEEDHDKVKQERDEAVSILSTCVDLRVQLAVLEKDRNDWRRKYQESRDELDKYRLDKEADLRALTEAHDQWRNQAKTLQVTNSEINNELQALKKSMKATKAWWNSDFKKYDKLVKDLEVAKGELLEELDAVKTKLHAVTVSEQCWKSDYKEGEKLVNTLEFTLSVSRADLAAAEKVIAACEAEVKATKKKLKRALTLLGLR